MFPHLLHQHDDPLLQGRLGRVQWLVGEGQELRQALAEDGDEGKVGHEAGYPGHIVSLVGIRRLVVVDAGGVGPVAGVVGQHHREEARGVDAGTETPQLGRRAHLSRTHTR